MAVYTKEQCNYREGDWPEECGTCIHSYQELPRIVRGNPASHEYPAWATWLCKIVEGSIGDRSVCDFWTTGRLSGKQLESSQEDISI